ncbi:MAG: HAMP domain-containing sensor histidine kinase [Deltaproteobacteria bacterium]
MSEDVSQSSSERQQTDDSLRAEREKADQAFDDELSAVDEVADTVISRARRLADEVLAAARARTDRQDPLPGENVRSPESIQGERVREDRALRKERAEADEVILAERAEHVAALTMERAETDKDLLAERARTDSAIAMRDEFLSVVSHELRNQLNSMVLFATLIGDAVRKADHVELVADHARRSRRAGARMDRLIGDLVDVASIEAGRLAVRREELDPTAIVNEAVTTFQSQAAASHLSLRVELVEPMPVVALDPARILQVLINLLTNAFKFTPPNGTVAVRVERSGEELRFTVSDSGAGIPPEQLESVFERYAQVTKNDRRGLGLGLYISKCIVHGHGGQIWAESTMGKGSTFCFTLPLAAVPSER